MRGGNHYPSDIEQTAGASHVQPRRRLGAAFGIEVHDEERVVIVQEVQREHVRTCNHAEVCQAIRQAVVDDHLVPLHAILLVRPGSVPKTTSGKIQRGEARRMYLDGEFKVVAGWEADDQPGPAVPSATKPSRRVEPTAAPEGLGNLSSQQRRALHDLQQWVLSRLSERLGMPATAIDVHQPFARYGIDSLKAVRLSGELEEYLGRPVAPTSLYDYPNVAALVRYLVLGNANGHTPVAQRSCTDEPIAVVGVGCRFPGSPSPEAFWDLLNAGRDAIGPVPSDRWGETLQRVADQSRNGRPAVTCGGFLEQIDQFDAALFGITPREAEEMDPQQRLLLEVVWETFEHAGISVDRVGWLAHRRVPGCERQ